MSNSDEFSDGLRRLAVAGRRQHELLSCTDRQIGQLMFDHLWDEFELASAAMSIGMEATHRLFRSSAGERKPDEVLNDPDELPTCPRCGQPMLHYIGDGEPDYRKCTSLKCELKTPEPPTGEHE